MQLLKLEVRNWVHHRYQTCEFTRGLVAILGENGSGKSSLFGAIRWLLTGENPNYGVKADNISQYAKDGEPAYATLEFEHNGHFATVTRHLLPEKEQATLTVDGKEVARGDKMVTAGVEKLLGVDAKFISRFIIVSQTEIFSFIDDSQTDTDKFFQRLFNTAKADKCQDIIGKSLLKVAVPEVLKPSSQLALEIADLEKERDTLNAQISTLPGLDDFLQAQERDQKIIAQWAEREKAGVELQQLDKSAQENEKLLAGATATCEQYEKDFDVFVAATNGKAESHREAKIALGHWENYKNIAKIKESFQSQREAIQVARDKDPQPEKPGEVLSEKLWRDVQALELRVKSVEQFIAVFSKDGVAECPTCHTPSAQLAAQKEQYATAIDGLRKELVDFRAAAMRQANLEREWDTWERRCKLREIQEQQVAVSEKELLAVRAPEIAEEELRQTVSDYEDFSAAQSELQPLIQEAQKNISRYKGLLAAIAEQREKLLEQIKNVKTTAADAHLAQASLDKLRQRCQQRQILEQERATLLAEIAQREKQRVAAQKKEHDAVKIRQWATIAERARDALKNAPRLVAQRNLQRLETAINELLQIFSVNFLVRVAGDGTPTFIAEFYDGRRQVAQRLSIGQKTVLALAFRVAVNAQFAEEIGLLALDEPTASLDAPRIQALAPVLEKLRDLSTAKGLQCLLVTHATSLSHLFESTIELAPPELRHVRTAG